ncbi:MAG: UbiD family decarboxylase, partial [Dehalococcoidia bacterium]|nr:UbiD family decarboxylase [Dehalococcoidia bacterium]
MKICKDLREFLEIMDEMGEMITIDEEVDPHNFELSSLIRHSEAGPNKAVYFPLVKGYGIPVVGNLFGSLRRCYLACGIEPQQEDVERYRDDPRGSPGGRGGMSGMLMNAFTMNDADRAGMVMMRERILWAEDEAAGGRARTKLAPTGPCKEVKILKDFDLPAFLPVPWHCEGDVGPYINPAGLVQRDPDSGILNIGVRRHQVTYEPYGKDRMGVLIVEATDGYKILEKYEAKNQACPVALCIGLDPVTEIMANYNSAHFSVPNPSYSEFDSASAIMGRPLEMVKCETVDLEVPANTEIVIEGFIPAHDRLQEGPMAEFTDMYAMKGLLPYIQVTAITHRKN